MLFRKSEDLVLEDLPHPGLSAVTGALRTSSPDLPSPLAVKITPRSEMETALFSLPYTFILESFFLARSPVAAIVAKYWMTRLVFTVFPAPDSPLFGVIKRERERETCPISINTLPEMSHRGLDVLQATSDTHLPNKCEKLLGEAEAQGRPPQS